MRTMVILKKFLFLYSKITAKTSLHTSTSLQAAAKQTDQRTQQYLQHYKDVGGPGIRSQSKT